MYTEEQGILLSLLSHELFGTKLELDASSVNWPALLAESDRHAVTALVFPGVMQLPGISDELMNRICGAAVSASQESERMLQAQQEILKLLEQNAIPCAVLKGTSVARLYPHPELRVPGDIDILVSKDKLEMVCGLLGGQGFVQTEVSEKHTCMDKPGVSVEVHTMVSVFPDTLKGATARETMADAEGHTEAASLGGSTFPVLSGLYQIISLLVHMEQHLSDAGIGLRQLCDWAVTVNAYRDQIGAAELNQLDCCGLLCFAKIVTRICEKYLGLPPIQWCADADEELADALAEDILKGGNFRAQAPQRPFGGVLTDAYNEAGRTKTSTLHSYFRYIRKRIAYDHPWAKGGFWLVVFGIFYPLRWTVRMLLGKRKKFNVKQAISSARQREELLRRLKLYK